MQTNKSMNIWIINGPNLNLLGKRNPEVYGSQTWVEYFEILRSKYQSPKVSLQHFQSNHEGYIIDKIQEIGFDNNTYAIINPGGLTHTSVSLRDAIEAVNVEFVEVHISDIHQREEFRKHSFITEVSNHTIMGQGIKGYALAIDYLLDKNDNNSITEPSTS